MSSRQRSRGRSPGGREKLPRVLIVTEGSETEVLYFQDFCADHNLGSVDVDGGSDSNPLSVVEYGLTAYEKDDEYDRLYCVFDRDRHDGFDAAVEQLKDLRNPPEPEDVHWTFSIPCFEYWILLHYENTASPYTHPDSPCSRVIDDVENHLSSYGKSMTELYEETKPYLEEAIGRSRRRWKQAKGIGSLNPSTKVHKLVSYLRGIRP